MGSRIRDGGPQSPWQRGSNENTNRLLRQYFPKDIDISGFSQTQLSATARLRNEPPRKTLQYHTPAEKFEACVAATRGNRRANMSLKKEIGAMLCKIGDVEVWRILEIHAPFMTPEALFPNAGPNVGEIVDRLVPGGLCQHSGRLMLPIQGFLLKTPSHNILVDSCVGNDKTSNITDWHQRSDTRFMAALTAAGMSVGDIDYVLCTHLHSDHIGWNTRLEDGRWVPTFPNARYLMPQADEQVQRLNNGPLYVESVLPVVEAGQVELVGAGHMLGDHVTLIPTPGHTPGHVSVLVSSGGTSALITGDAIHSTAQCWHPEWHFKYDTDGPLAVTSRRALLEQASETQCLVLGSHFALPSLGHVRANKGVFRWDG